MDILEGKAGNVTVCGELGGLPFENVTRADVNGACPDNYYPCIEDADPENMLCYKKDDI